MFYGFEPGEEMTECAIIPTAGGYGMFMSRVQPIGKQLIVGLQRHLRLQIILSNVFWQIRCVLIEWLRVIE